MKRISLFIIMVLITVSTAWGDTATVNDVVAALQAPFSMATPAAGRIEDFQADFTQRSHIASIDREQKGLGTVSFKFVNNVEKKESSALFRWSYTKPAIQEIISDGQMMWVYLPENRQVIESDISQVEQQGQNPVTFLTNLGDLARDFTIKAANPLLDQAGNYCLNLIPHQPSPQFSAMTVVVAKDAVENYQQGRKATEFPLLLTTVSDVQGNSTAIEFSHITINPGLKNSLFAFEKPADVEVLTPTEQLNF